MDGFLADSESGRRRAVPDKAESGKRCFCAFLEDGCAIPNKPERWRGSFCAFFESRVCYECDGGYVGDCGCCRDGAGGELSAADLGFQMRSAYLLAGVIVFSMKDEQSTVPCLVGKAVGSRWLNKMNPMSRSE